jgi:hypothetical protein
MDKLELDIEWVTNSPELKADMQKTQADILGVGATAEKTAAKVAASVNAIAQQQQGLLDRLQFKLDAAKDERIGAKSVKSIELANQKIQEYGREITRLKRIGMQGFDDLGNKIRDFADKPVGLFNRTEAALKLYQKASKETFNEELISKYNSKIEQTKIRLDQLRKAGTTGFDVSGNALQAVAPKPTGRLERLQYAANLFTGMAAGSSNDEIITKYNRKLQETQKEIARVKNMGKEGFDTLGNSITASGEKVAKTTNYLNKAWAALRNIAYLVPGLGIAGLIGLLVEPVMEFFSALTLAEKMTKQFNATSQETASLIAKEVAETTILVDKIKDNNLSDQERNSLLGEFIGKNPAVLSALNLQNIATAEGTRILDEHTKSLRKKIELQQLEKAYVESIQREADLKSGKLSDETDKNGFSNALFTAGQVLLFGSKEKTEAAIKANNERLRASAANGQKIISEGYLKKIQAATDGANNLNKVEDSSLTAMEKRLASVNGRLSNLQKGQDAEKFKAERASLEKQIEARKKLLGLDSTFKKDSTASIAAAIKAQRLDDQSVKAKQALEQKILDIKNEYARKSLTADEAEIKAVRDKFQKLADEVVKFNANPKNKRNQADGSGLKTALNSAVRDITYRQDTEKLTIEIEKQKVIFEEFEQYKLDFGLKKANERFAGELKGYKSNTDYLKAQLSLNLLGTVGGSTGAQADRVKGLSNALLASQKNDEKIISEHLIRVYQDTQTYDQKKLALEEQYQKDLQALQGDAYAGNRAVLKVNLDNDLTQLEENRVEKLEFFRVLFGDIENTSKRALRKAISEANKELQRLGSDPKFAKQVADVKKAIKSATESIDKRSPDGLRILSSTFRDLASTVGGLDVGLGKALSLVSEMAQQSANVAENLSRAEAGFAKGGDVLSGISGTIGALGSAFSIMKGLGNLITANDDRKEEQRKRESEASLERTKKSIDSLTGALERQAKVADRAFGVDRISVYKNQVELAKRSIVDTINSINALGRAQEGSTGGRPNREGTPGLGGSDVTTLNAGLFTLAGNSGGRPSRAPETPGLATIDEVIEANRKKIEALYQQLNTGRLEETLAKQLKDQLALYDELEGKLDQYREKLRETLTGTTASNLVDGIAEALRDNASAEDYANNFKKLMQDAILQSLKLKSLEVPLKAFYEQFAKDAESAGGIDGDEMKALRATYDKIIADAKKEADDLQKVTGIDFKEKSSSSKNSLTGSIRAEITEATGTVVAGRLGGIQIAAIESNKIAKENGQTQMQGLAVMKDILLYAIKNEENTRNTVVEVKNVVTELKSMNFKMGRSVNAGPAAGFP